MAEDRSIPYRRGAGGQQPPRALCCTAPDLEHPPPVGRRRAGGRPPRTGPRDTRRTGLTEVAAVLVEVVGGVAVPPGPVRRPRLVRSGSASGYGPAGIVGRGGRHECGIRLCQTAGSAGASVAGSPSSRAHRCMAAPLASSPAPTTTVTAGGTAAPVLGRLPALLPTFVPSTAVPPFPRSRPTLAWWCRSWCPRRPSRAASPGESSWSGEWWWVAEVAGTPHQRRGRWC